MRIPDDERRPRGVPPIEDREGYVLCSQCSRSPLDGPYSVREGSWWLCSAFRDWRRSWDVIQYRCPRFALRSCKSCVSHGEECERALLEEEGLLRWCSRYRARQRWRKRTIATERELQAILERQERRRARDEEGGEEHKGE